MFIQHVNEGGYLDDIEFEEVAINENVQRFGNDCKSKHSVIGRIIPEDNDAYVY